MSLKFYLNVIKHAWHDPLFRAGALHESWGVLRQYLPGRLVTRRSEYVYCSYAGQPGQKDKGRWLPPQSLRFLLTTRPPIMAQQMTSNRVAGLIGSIMEVVTMVVAAWVGLVVE